MRLDICEAAASRCKAARYLTLARKVPEPRRSDFLGLAQVHAQKAWMLAEQDRAAAPVRQAEDA